MGLPRASAGCESSRDGARPSRGARRKPTAADVRRLLRDSGPTMVAQPILDLTLGAVTGYEALARFPQLPGSAPQDWFCVARRAGYGTELETRAVARALDLGACRPPGTFLSVNVSPNVLGSSEFLKVLPRDLSAVQLEITEHELARDASALLGTVERLRRRGVQVAIDDVGEGYAGLRRLMAIHPDVLKLDRAIVTGVSEDPAKIAMLEAIVHFAARTGSRVCAEGVETVQDLVTVSDLDVGLAQGWVIGRPADAFFTASIEAQAEFASRGVRRPGTDNGVPHDLPHLLEGLADAADLATVGYQIASAAVLLGCDVVRLAVLDDGERRLRTVAVHPEESVTEWGLDEAPTASLVVTERVIGQVLASTVCPDAGERHLLARAGCRSLLLFPLVGGGESLGLLACLRRDERPWSRLELRTARAVAAAAGPVVRSVTRHGANGR